MVAPKIVDDDFAEWIMSFRNSPLDAVCAWYPWGEGALKHSDGPDKWQARVLARLQKRLAQDPHVIRIAVRSGHGSGKQICVDEWVPTPNGMRPWGDIRPGDLLFGSDGSPTRVTARFDHIDQRLYRVTFDDGSSIRVGGPHQWAVRGRQERRRGIEGWRVMTTEEILEAGVKRPNGTALDRKWEIPVQGPAQFEEREVDIHPYLMGVWLGDGSKGVPSYCKPHPEATDKVRALGYDVSERADGKQKYVLGISHLIDDPVFYRGSHERYIPNDYKFNTVENRRALFEGLCDSDGECTDCGSICYSSSSERLIEDVMWLARSLGCKVMRQPAVRSGWYPHPETGERVECRDSHRITINAPFNPFAIAHKRDAFRVSEERYRKRWIESIEPDGRGDAMCVTVAAEDELYQATDFIVTHNTALIAWIIHWFTSTRPNPQVVVTANTKTQLSTKTWRELAKWQEHVINGDWFQWSATKYALKGSNTWYASAIPWSKNNPQAFAGTHEKHVLILLDEASEVAPEIWETVEGALTTHGAIMMAFGNPSSVTGRFAEIWHRFSNLWDKFQVDIRYAKMANQTLVQEWIDTYGEDSDFVRVRVKGLPPKQGAKSLIGRADAVAAAKRDIPVRDVNPSAPLLMGVDIARDGNDDCVILLRKGPKVHKDIKVFKERDLMKTAGIVAMEINNHRPDVVFIDAVGMGAGVLDRLIMLNYGNVVGVKSGEQADDKDVYFNRRIEMWHRMAVWIKGADIPYDERLIDELTAPEYHYDVRDLLRLEKKEDMERRGLSSPDVADALALTFSYKVPAKAGDESVETEPDVV